jgi:hypothetical protein
MEKEFLFAIISIAIYLVGIIPYWRDTIRWRTIPHPFAAMVWLILTGFNGYVLILHKEYYSLLSLPILLTSIVVFWIGYGFHGIKKISINWFDYLAFISSIVIILYWYISANTLNAVIMTVIVDFVSFLPVIKKSWLHPWTENSFAYFTWLLNTIFLFLAQSLPNFETSIYWITYSVLNTSIITILISRRWYIRWWSSIFE